MSEQTAPAVGPQPWQADREARDIHGAFVLGWSLVELRARVQIAAFDREHLPPAASGASPAGDPEELVKGPNERLLRSSRLRTLFNTIVSLQRDRFHDLSTADTLYDPPPAQELGYLYPQAAPDYAEVGIAPLADGAGWERFRLYDVTRRALNCLTLLLTAPQDSLTPQLLGDLQRRLVAAVIATPEQAPPADQVMGGAAGAAGAAVVAAAPAYDAPPPAALSLAATMIQACRAAPRQPADSPAASPQVMGGAAGESAPGQAYTSDHGMSVATLSFLCVRMLQSWDGFLRERLADVGVGSRSLLALIAYEAGRSLAGLSWVTSVNAVKVEARSDEQAAGELAAIWQRAMQSDATAQAIQQIGALSAALDDIYYRAHPRPAALATGSASDDLLVKPDPALPSQAIGAVRESLIYWQRTVAWLTTHQDTMGVSDWRGLRLALVAQSGVWFNLMTCQQDLRGFTADRVASQMMRNELDRLLRSFRTATGQVGKIRQDVTQVATDGIAQAIRRVQPALWAVVGLSVLVVLGLLVYITVTGNIDSLAGLLTSLVTAVAGALGIGGSNMVKAASQSEVSREIKDTTDAHQEQMGGAVGLLSGALGQAGGYLLDAYTKGLARIQIELQTLNHSVSVAGPLIEFFLRRNDVRDDLDFLTKIVWDSQSREAQLQNVVMAAFGPIALLLGDDAPAGASAAPASAPSPQAPRAAAE